MTTDNVNSHDGSLSRVITKREPQRPKTERNKTSHRHHFRRREKVVGTFLHLPATCNKGTLYEINESMHLIFHECSSVVCMLLKETVV